MKEKEMQTGKVSIVRIWAFRNSRPISANSDQIFFVLVVNDNNVQYKKNRNLRKKFCFSLKGFLSLVRLSLYTFPRLYLGQKCLLHASICLGSKYDLVIRVFSQICLIPTRPNVVCMT